MSDTVTLQQKLVAVAKQVGKIKFEGKNQYGKAALSIYDVENAIREPLAEAGILTRWSSTEAYDLEGTKGWRVVLSVTISDADGGESFVDTVTDTGSTISGAVSFAKKQYYRGLFHLADEEEDGPAKPTGTTKSAYAQANDNSRQPAKAEIPKTPLDSYQPWAPATKEEIAEVFGVEPEEVNPGDIVVGTDAPVTEEKFLKTSTIMAWDDAQYKAAFNKYVDALKAAGDGEATTRVKKAFMVTTLSEVMQRPQTERAMLLQALAKELNKHAIPF
jgi:hypothetical protein